MASRLDKFAQLEDMGYVIEAEESGAILNFPDGETWVQLSEYEDGYFTIALPVLAEEDVTNRAVIIEAIAHVNCRSLGSRFCLMNEEIWLIHDAYPYVEKLDELFIPIKQMIWNRQQLLPLLYGCQQLNSVPTEEDIDYAFLAVESSQLN